MAQTVVTRGLVQLGRLRPWGALIAILLFAFNLRLAITAVSPLLPELRFDLGISSTAAGMITAIPVLCFGLFAPVAAWLASRTSFDRLAVAALIVVAIGVVIRSTAGFVTVLLGTTMIGAGLAAGNVLVPALVKRDFAHAMGWVTGLYTCVLMLGAAMSAGATAMLSSNSGLSWRVCLAIWLLPCLLALVAWIVRSHGRTTPRPSTSIKPPVVRAHVWRSPLAWQLAIFMAAQSLVFLAIFTWLPALLIEHGVTVRGGGFAVAVYSLVGILGSLIFPPLASRLPSQRLLTAVPCGVWLMALIGLATAPDAFALWTVLAGIGQGATMTMALTLITLRSDSPAVARDLAGMVLTVGYLASAPGPMIVGALRDGSHGWVVPMGFLSVVTLAMGVAGVLSGRPRQLTL